ncbi:hypothetical protein [Puniceicoccus vermicola]|uniref:Uncharacterized protein n=1 Tax=Puniceicoccus vermicola TaxID=388746 RepID=A0A7X1AZ74_9BACT|nr:hypothetical protein [Puniceicoccus vermicola]MBC2602667.1 hypothetical protein [Puniceicoccus vermicola]
MNTKPSIPEFSKFPTVGTLKPKRSTEIASSRIGVMNTQACEHSYPPLISITLGAQEIGRVAFELLD